VFHGDLTAVSLKKWVELSKKTCHSAKIVLISDFVTLVTDVSFWVSSDHIALKTWIKLLLIKEGKNGF
jgi:hypothetical protein